MAHIINPVKVKESSDLYFAQPITFESMRRAKGNASDVSIELLSTQFDEDLEIIPSGFKVLANLERSILDINPRLQGRKLPLIKDVLLRASENTSAEYLIYTNADIGLMPHFYQYV